MTDLATLISDLCKGLGSDPDPVFPDFPGPFPGNSKPQIIDSTKFSRFSRLSRSENDDMESDGDAGLGNYEFSAASHARTSSYVGAPGKPGKPGNGPKTPAETTPPPFPVNFLEPGKPGNQEPVAGAFPPPGDPLPINPSEVRAGVARELRALDDLGRTGPDALRDAIEITAAKIRNSEVLAERQANGSRCHVCNGSLNDGHPVVSVLTGKRGAHLHMHDTCHAEHRARRTALVDRIMAAAGYGPAQTGGKAA